MKQRIVIKVQVRCDKCRSKAMEIAAVADGVISLALEGDNKDNIVVIGDGVDATNLTIQLKKKLGYASLEIVEEVKEKQESKAKDKDTEPTPVTTTSCSSSCQSNCECQLYAVVYDPRPSPCTIM